MLLPPSSPKRTGMCPHRGLTLALLLHPGPGSDAPQRTKTRPGASKASFMSLPVCALPTCPRRAPGEHRPPAMKCPEGWGGAGLVSLRGPQVCRANPSPLKTAHFLRSSIPRKPSASMVLRRPHQQPRSQPQVRWTQRGASELPRSWKGPCPRGCTAAQPTVSGEHPAEANLSRGGKAARALSTSLGSGIRKVPDTPHVGITFLELGKTAEATPS